MVPSAHTYTQRDIVQILYRDEERVKKGKGKKKKETPKKAKEILGQSRKERERKKISQVHLQS